MSQFFSCLRQQGLQFKCLNCFRPKIPSPIIRRIIWFSRLLLVMFMSQSWRVVKLWCGQQIFSIVQSPDLKIVDFFAKNRKQEVGCESFCLTIIIRNFLMSSMAAAGWAQVGLREHKAKLQQTKETCFEPTTRGRLLFINFLWVWWLGACTIKLLTNIMTTEAILTCKFLLIFINITLNNF